MDEELVRDGIRGAAKELREASIALETLLPKSEVLEQVNRASAFLLTATGALEE